MKRYVSLDVMRGLTVACMILVNNPGSWSHVFPLLRHAEWVGCTPTDLVFPFFVFCMGAAMAFSLQKYQSAGKAALKIFKRGIAIFLVGLLLNMFPFNSGGTDWGKWFGEIRIFGVLQRIALSYILAGLLALWLKKPLKLLAAIAVLSVIHTFILVRFDTGLADFMLEGNAASKIDIAVIGESHLYHQYRFYDGTPAAFDPEGLLGTLTTACTALIGFLAGSMIRRSSARYASASERTEKDSPVWVVSRIYTYSVLCLAFSLILSIWIPVGKPLWTVSYTFYSAGWALLVLAFFSYFIDVLNVEKPFVPLKMFGMNPLFLYALSVVLSKTIISVIGWTPASVFGGNECMSLLYALLFVLLHFVVAAVMYSRKIFIRL